MGWGRVCFGAFLRCTAAEERVLGCCGMHGLCSDLSSPQADLFAQLSPFNVANQIELQEVAKSKSNQELSEGAPAD